MSQITIFSAPKPFTNPHIATIQRNAIQSWLRLPDAETLLIGEESGLAELAAGLGVAHLPQVARNAQGTPLLSDIFALARKHSASPLLAYVNADVILLPDFVAAARLALALASPTPALRERGLGGEGGFLIVGQRWDLDVRQPLDFGEGWEARLSADVAARGRLHPPTGSDYFLFPRNCFIDMPPFAVGRAGWDNWTIFHARQRGWPVIDATSAVQVIHQDHDYSHLPGGQPHYRQPESFDNIRLAGGRRAIYHLEDASHRFEGAAIRRIPLRGRKLWREVETFPLNVLHSRGLGELFFALFHPVKAWGEWRGRLAYRLRKQR